MTTREKAIISETTALKMLPGATFSGGEPDKRWHNYDIDWGELKIEVKMSTTYPHWAFGSDSSCDDLDYYMWMGYRNMQLLRVFFVPARDLRHLAYGNIKILDSSTNSGRRSKYFKYEVDKDKEIPYRKISS